MPNLAELIDTLTGGQPIAYDRRFRIPIHKSSGLRDNVLADFKVNPALNITPSTIAQTPTRIHINQKLFPNYQEGGDLGNKVLKHELVHALQTLMAASGKYNRFTANLDTPDSGWISALKNWFKPDPLESVKDRIWKLAKEPGIKSAGGTTEGIGDIDAARTTTGMSDWAPWFLTNTLPEGLNEKFTENEKKLMKQYLTNEFMRLAPDNLKKYRNIWE